MTCSCGELGLENAPHQFAADADQQDARTKKLAEEAPPDTDQSVVDSEADLPDLISLLHHSRQTRTPPVGLA